MKWRTALLLLSPLALLALEPARVTIDTDTLPILSPVKHVPLVVETRDHTCLTTLPIGGGGTSMAVVIPCGTTTLGSNKQDCVTVKGEKGVNGGGDGGDGIFCSNGTVILPGKGGGR